MIRKLIQIAILSGLIATLAACAAPGRSSPDPQAALPPCIFSDITSQGYAVDDSEFVKADTGSIEILLDAYE